MINSEGHIDFPKRSPNRHYKFHSFLLTIEKNEQLPFSSKFELQVLYWYNHNRSGLNKLFKNWTVMQFNIWAKIKFLENQGLCIPECSWETIRLIMEGKQTEDMIKDSGLPEDWINLIEQSFDDLVETITNIYYRNGRHEKKAIDRRPYWRDHCLSDEQTTEDRGEGSTAKED